jgi:hypothetical protein
MMRRQSQRAELIEDLEADFNDDEEEEEEEEDEGKELLRVGDTDDAKIDASGTLTPAAAPKFALKNVHSRPVSSLPPDLMAIVISYIVSARQLALLRAVCCAW